MASKKTPGSNDHNLDSIKVKTLEEILQEKRSRSKSDSGHLLEDGMKS